MDTNSAPDFAKAWTIYSSMLLFLLTAGLIVASIVTAVQALPFVSILLALFALFPLMIAGVVLVCFAVYRAR